MVNLIAADLIEINCVDTKTGIQTLFVLREKTTGRELQVNIVLPDSIPVRAVDRKGNVTEKTPLSGGLIRNFL